MKKTGLVLEGGSFRGIFTAGVLDYLMEHEIAFPYIIGVSTGAENAINYIVGQKNRVHEMVSGEGANNYFGFQQYVQNGIPLRLDDVAYRKAFQQIPIDFSPFFTSDTECEFVLSNCQTGKADYLKCDGTETDLLKICSASCSVPLLCSPVQLRDSFYMDGSLIDLVPIARALKKCQKAVVILTKTDTDEPTDYSKMGSLINISYCTNFPALADSILKRKDTYINQLKYIAKKEKEGSVFVIKPEKFNSSEQNTNKDKREMLYKLGQTVMKNKMDSLISFLQS